MVGPKAFRNKQIIIDESKLNHFDRNTFGNIHTYPQNTLRRFKEIVDSWVDQSPELKTFTCDECGKNLDIDLQDGKRKGFHVWWKMPDEKTLVELHFHKACGDKLPLW